MTMLFSGHGSVAPRTTQPAGYETEIPWTADVKVSVRAGGAAGEDGLAVGSAVAVAGAEVAAGVGVGVTLGPAEQPPTMTARASTAQRGEIGRFAFILAVPP
jgi:hypothetical protein